ncbi:hypothetical protein [Mycobacterium sp. 141]|uniref:hypothetical protein n=1 Tax=Mycobacterium sp. 141 TaxID=1120797 RepID=UPI00036E01FE|nr:hypothetical protein [Mycobacterium sp. 141]
MSWRPAKALVGGILIGGNPILVQIQGGQVKAIAPPESAQAPIIYPLPPLG